MHGVIEGVHSGHGSGDSTSSGKPCRDNQSSNAGFSIGSQRHKGKPAPQCQIDTAASERSAIFIVPMMCHVVGTWNFFHPGFCVSQFPSHRRRGWRLVFSQKGQHLADTWAGLPRLMLFDDQGAGAGLVGRAGGARREEERDPVCQGQGHRVLERANSPARILVWTMTG